VRPVATHQVAGPLSGEGSSASPSSGQYAGVGVKNMAGDGGIARVGRVDVLVRGILEHALRFGARAERRT
jgi:hypothetical protein